MAARTNKKQPKKNIWQKLMGSHKSRLLVFIGAFALIGGTYYLYKSFAATQLVYFRPGDALAYNNVPGFTSNKATVKSVTTGDGKKATTANSLNLKSNSQNNSGVPRAEYSTSLPAGHYRACSNIKLNNSNSLVHLWANQNTYTAITSDKNHSDQLGLKLIKNGESYKICTLFGVTNSQNERVTVSLIAHEEFQLNSDTISFASDVTIDDISIELFNENEEVNSVFSNLYEASMRNKSTGKPYFGAASFSHQSGPKISWYFENNSLITTPKETINGISKQPLAIKQGDRLVTSLHQYETVKDLALTQLCFEASSATESNITANLTATLEDNREISTSDTIKLTKDIKEYCVTNKKSILWKYFTVQLTNSGSDAVKVYGTWFKDMAGLDTIR